MQLEKERKVVALLGEMREGQYNGGVERCAENEIFRMKKLEKKDRHVSSWRWRKDRVEQEVVVYWILSTKLFESTASENGFFGPALGPNGLTHRAHQAFLDAIFSLVGVTPLRHSRGCPCAPARRASRLIAIGKLHGRAYEVH